MERLRTIGRFDNLVPLASENLGKQFAREVVILGNQDSARSTHRLGIARKWSLGRVSSPVK
jgi:hypothetical protein